ncbi:MAG TPA: LysR family transcriptional regulator [Steroidobacteraceae bacterium]|nr:LysR family transcriptional regulator [Steroidobacteraceae bacterium]
MIPADRIDLTLLSRFLAVVEHGSFAKASRALNLTQQAVAYSIASLEKTLGVPLFARGNVGAIPTEYGVRLTHHARALLSEAKRTIDGLHALQLAAAGHIRVGVSESLSAQVLPLAIARLLSQHPDIEIAIREGTSHRVHELLQKGEIDFMVGAPWNPIPLGDNLEQQLLFEDVDYVAMRAHHPIARLAAPQIADLQPLTWIVSQSRDDDYQQLCESFLAAGVKPPQHVIRSDGLAIGMSLLLMTDCVSLTALRLAPRMMNPELGGLFRAYRIPGLDRKRRAFIRYIRSTTLSVAARMLIEEVLRAAAEIQQIGGED